VRFHQAGEGGPGEVLAVQLGAPPRAGAPALLRLKAPHGEGRWTVLALGEEAGSGTAALALAEELTRAGRPEAALEVLAAFARAVPSAPGRTEALLLASRIAETFDGRPEAEAGKLERASRRLGAPVLVAEEGVLRYRAGYEALVQGTGPAAEAAALKVVAIGAPCGPAEVAARAAAFLKWTPAPTQAPEARRLQARALEALFHAAPRAGQPAARLAAQAAWRAAEKDGGEVAVEARKRLAALSSAHPAATGDVGAPVCR
jgi:hypothetical protein